MRPFVGCVASRQVQSVSSYLTRDGSLSIHWKWGWCCCGQISSVDRWSCWTMTMIRLTMMVFVSSLRLRLGHGYEHRHRAEKRDETIERWRREWSAREYDQSVLMSYSADQLLSEGDDRSMVNRRSECRGRWRRSSLASPRPWLMSVGTARLSSLCSLLLCRAMWCWLPFEFSLLWCLHRVDVPRVETDRDIDSKRERERERSEEAKITPMVGTSRGPTIDERDELRWDEWMVASSNRTEPTWRDEKNLMHQSAWLNARTRQRTKSNSPILSSSLNHSSTNSISNSHE